MRCSRSLPSLCSLVVVVACANDEAAPDSAGVGGAQLAGMPAMAGWNSAGGVAGVGGLVSAGGQAAGGAFSAGGVFSAGGALSAGGVSGLGGAASGRSSGGSRTTGGAFGTGGAPTGGSSATSGGSKSSGGATSLGGAAALGGSTAGGAGGAPDAWCPPGITRSLRVAKDGSAQFKSVQAAVDSLSNGSSEHVRIDIAAGSYSEKLTIAGRSQLCLVGASEAATVLTYADSNEKVGSTSGSASVFISANDFSAARITFENTHGPGSQAVALRTTGQRQQFLDCRFVGYQDTLYVHNGSQYFRNCYVQGNTDFVFGGATAVLDGCEVRNVAGGSAVAAPNTAASAAYGIVFLGGTFTAASGVRANSVGLGRPWGADGAAAYLNATLGAHIIAEGFVPMSGNQPENARFDEYGSTGPGARATERASYQISQADAARYELSRIFNGWSPSYAK